MFAWLKLLNPKVWLYLAVAIAVAAYTGAVYRAGGSAPRAELSALKTDTKMAGERAIKLNKEKENDWKARIKVAEDNSGPAWANLNGWVRKNPSRRSIVPAPTGTPVGTDRAGQVCFVERELDAALRQFVGGVEGLVGEGEEAVIDRSTLIQSWPK